MGNPTEFDDFFSLDIPETKPEYKVNLVLDNAFILVDNKGSGVKVKKTEKNKHWKLGDIVHLEE